MSEDPAITRIPRFSCPRCGYVMDAAGTTDGAPGTPTPGDSCGCINCGLAMVFIDPLGTGALQLRPMRTTEFEALPDEVKTELARVQYFAQHVYPQERARRN